MLKHTFLKNRFFYLLGLIVVVLCFGFAWNPLVYVGFTGLAGLLVFTVQDWFMLRKALPALEASRPLPKHFSMFDDNEVRLEVKNASGLSVQLRVIDEIPVQFQQRDFDIRFKLEAGDSRELRYLLKPLERGEYFFEKLHLFVSGKTQLVVLRKSFDLSKMLKVYPSFIQMRMFELMVFSADRAHPGIKKIRKIGHGYEFSDIRQYVAGDDPRTLNWKVSSRSTEMMVNNYQDEKSQQVYAIINKSRVMRMPFHGLSLMDYAINTALTTLNIVLKNHDHAGLLTFAKEVEEFIPAKSRNYQLQLILDSLYNQKESSHEANYQGLFQAIRQKVKGRSLLLMFTNFMSLNSVFRALPELQRINRSHLLVVIFFENTELENFRNQEVQTTLDIASKTMADKLSHELTQAIYELRNAGIQTIQTKPEDLTANTINKYLELKSRGMI